MFFLQSFYKDCKLLHNLVATSVSKIFALVLKLGYNFLITGISNLIILCPIITSALDNLSNASSTDKDNILLLSTSFKTRQCILVHTSKRPSVSISKIYFIF